MVSAAANRRLLMRKLIVVIVLLAFQHGQVLAEDGLPMPGNLIVSQGLQVVLALMVTLATIWGLSRFAIKKNFHRATDQQRIRMIDSIALGARERIILLEVENQHIVVASTPGNLHSLHAFEKKSATSFSAALSSEESTLTTVATNEPTNVQRADGKNR